MMHINGMPVISDPLLMREVRRTIIERMFSRPWKPFRKTKKVPGMYLINGTTIVAHPAKIAQLRKELQ